MPFLGRSVASRLVAPAQPAYSFQSYVPFCALSALFDGIHPLPSKTSVRPKAKRVLKKVIWCHIRSVTGIFIQDEPGALTYYLFRNRKTVSTR
jgi:hypothetical protein